MSTCTRTTRSSVAAFALGALALSPVALAAQAPGVALSEVVKFSDAHVAPSTVLPLGEGFATYSYRTQRSERPLALSLIVLAELNSLDEVRELTLHRFGKGLRAAGEYEVSWEGERDVFELFSLGDRLAWTYAAPAEGESKDYEIRAAILDAQGAEVANHSLATVARADYFGLAQHKATSHSRKFHLRVFAEESRQRLLSKRDDQPASVTLAVFGADGTLVSDVTAQLDVNRDQLDIRSAALDEDGNAYIAARVFTGSRRKEKRQGGSDSKVFVYRLAAGATELEKTELRLDGQYIEALEFYPTPSGQPTVVGLYSDRRDRRLMGAFATADPTGGEVLRPQPFTRAMLEALGDRVTTKRGGELVMEGSFEFRDSQDLPDGSLAILLESYYETTSSSGSTSSMRVRTIYHYEENVVLRFDPAGELAEAWLSPKSQAEVDQVSPFSSARLVRYGDGVGVLYNDNPKNLTRGIDERTRTLRFGNAVAVVAYQENGELQRRPLFARREADKVLLVPSSGTRLAGGELVFVAKRYKLLGKNELRFGLLGGEEQVEGM